MGQAEAAAPTAAARQTHAASQHVQNPSQMPVTKRGPGRPPKLKVQSDRIMS